MPDNQEPTQAYNQNISRLKLDAKGGFSVHTIAGYVPQPMTEEQYARMLLLFSIGDEIHSAGYYTLNELNPYEEDLDYSVRGSVNNPVPVYIEPIWGGTNVYVPMDDLGKFTLPKPNFQLITLLDVINHEIADSPAYDPINGSPVRPGIIVHSWGLNWTIDLDWNGHSDTALINPKTPDSVGYNPNWPYIFLAPFPQETARLTDKWVVQNLATPEKDTKLVAGHNIFVPMNPDGTYTFPPIPIQAVTIQEAFDAGYPVPHIDNPDFNSGLPIDADNQQYLIDPAYHALDRWEVQYLPDLPLKGDKGDQGVQGIQGIKGDQGDQGIQGIQGIKGDQGDQGIQGIQGIKGDQGIQGIQGIKGDQGATGPAGSDAVCGTCTGPDGGGTGPGGGGGGGSGPGGSPNPDGQDTSVYVQDCNTSIVDMPYCSASFTYANYDIRSLIEAAATATGHFNSNSEDLISAVVDWNGAGYAGVVTLNVQNPVVGFTTSNNFSPLQISDAEDEQLVIPHSIEDFGLSGILVVRGYHYHGSTALMLQPTNVGIDLNGTVSQYPFIGSANCHNPHDATDPAWLKGCLLSFVKHPKATQINVCSPLLVVGGTHAIWDFSNYKADGSPLFYECWGEFAASDSTALASAHYANGAIRMRYESSSFFQVASAVDATRIHCLVTAGVPNMSHDLGANGYLRLWAQGPGINDTYLAATYGVYWPLTNGTYGDTSSNATETYGGAFTMDSGVSVYTLQPNTNYFFDFNHDRAMQFSKIEVWIE